MSRLWSFLLFLKSSSAYQLASWKSFCEILISSKFFISARTFSKVLRSRESNLHALIFSFRIGTFFPTSSLSIKLANAFSPSDEKSLFDMSSYSTLLLRNISLSAYIPSRPSRLFDKFNETMLWFRGRFEGMNESPVLARFKICKHLFYLIILLNASHPFSLILFCS